MGAPREFSKTVHDKTGSWGTFPLDLPIQVGDIIQLEKDGTMTRVGSVLQWPGWPDALPIDVQAVNTMTSWLHHAAKTQMASAQGGVTTGAGLGRRARLTFGVYAPILLDSVDVSILHIRCTWPHWPRLALTLPSTGLNQTQQQGSTPTTVQPVGNSGSFYKFWEFGFRLGHYRLSGEKGTAHEQISNLDVGWGRFSNMASLPCPEPSYEGNGICNNPDPSVTLRYSNDFRMHVEGLLEVPATGGFSVGFSANVAAKGVNPTTIAGTPYIHIRPPDDLRFFFGYKFDIGNIAAKLANK